MSARPWRGTLIYVGAAAAIAAAGIGKFAAVPTEAVAAAPAAGTTSGGASASPAPSADGGTGASASPAPSTDDGSSTSTSPEPATSSDTVTIVGSVAQTRYGAVQVSVTFAGSEITDVQTLQAPDRERRSSEISQQSMPILAQEVLSAQSAQIDTVSGATYTTEGYRESVQAAIDQRG